MLILAYQGLSSLSAEKASGAKVVYRKVTRKRSKDLTIMLLPVLVFIGVIGWLIYALGNPAKRNAPRKLPKKEYITLLPIGLEEKQEIRRITQ